MSRHLISVRRSSLGYFSTNTIGTDALNAISSIPNVEDVSIKSESETFVELSYIYTSSEKFWETDEHLNKFGLERIWPEAH